MRIVNIMFSRGGGGIEQAFVDYCEGLKKRGHDVTAITHPKAFINDALKSSGIATVSIGNIGEWDPVTVLRLRRQLHALKTEIVIAHANRAFGLSRKAIRSGIPLVGVVQNYSTRRYGAGDAVFTTTHDLIDVLVRQGIARDKIFHIPNMVPCPDMPTRKANVPPVIGSMGRFVAKKGFDVYIDALKLLKERGLKFNAILGGTGVEEAALKSRAQAAGLDGILRFTGWVHDKHAFYTGIDLFCLPSLHEPFGIVLLEAFAHGTPVVSTDSEGPRDFIEDGTDALIVPMGNAVAMADALQRLLENPALAQQLAAKAYVKTKTVYSQEAVCERIEQALTTILARHRL